jgi:hypothetical protein
MKGWKRTLATAAIAVVIGILAFYYGVGAYKFYEIALEHTKSRIFAVTFAMVLWAVTVLAAVNLKQHPFVRAFLWVTKPFMAYLYALHIQAPNIVTSTLILSIGDVAATVLAAAIAPWLSSAQGPDRDRTGENADEPVNRPRPDIRPQAPQQRDSSHRGAAATSMNRRRKNRRRKPTSRGTPSKPANGALGSTPQKLSKKPTTHDDGTFGKPSKQRGA